MRRVGQILAHGSDICNKVTTFFSFGASDHDDVFSFPAALGGAEAYLFRWLAWPVTCTFLDVQG